MTAIQDLVLTFRAQQRKLKLLMPVFLEKGVYLGRCKNFTMLQTTQPTLAQAMKGIGYFDL